MLIFDRYILRELLVTILVASAILTLFLGAANAFRQLADLVIDGSLGPGEAVRLAGLLIPFCLSYSVPWGLLTGVVLLFGKMSANMELTALLSHGVPLHRVCLPVVGLGLALSLFCTWLNLDVIPGAKRTLAETAMSLAARNPLVMVPAGESVEISPGRKMLIADKSGSNLTGVHLVEVNEDDQATRVVMARAGVFLPDPESRGIILQLTGVRTWLTDRKDPSNPGRIREGPRLERATYPIPLAGLERAVRQTRRLAVLPTQEVQRISTTHEHPDKHKAGIEIAKRLSTGWACLVFSIVAIPVAITANRRETTMGFGIALGLAVAYYLLLVFSEVLSSRGANPGFMLWIPNIVFLAAGAVLFSRIEMR